MSGQSGIRTHMRLPNQDAGAKCLSGRPCSLKPCELPVQVPQADVAVDINSQTENHRHLYAAANGSRIAACVEATSKIDEVSQQQTRHQRVMQVEGTGNVQQQRNR